MRSDLRWCSDGFEFTCWNGEVVRGAFALDAHDREIIAWRATTGAGISGSDIRDMMLEAVEARFDGVRAPHPVQWLWDNGSIYTARETRVFAESLKSATGTVPRVCCQSQVNTMAASTASLTLSSPLRRPQCRLPRRRRRGRPGRVGARPLDRCSRGRRHCPPVPTRVAALGLCRRLWPIVAKVPPSISSLCPVSSSVRCASSSAQSANAPVVPASAATSVAATSSCRSIVAVPFKWPLWQNPRIAVTFRQAAIRHPTDHLPLSREDSRDVAADTTEERRRLQSIAGSLTPDQLALLEGMARQMLGNR